MKITDGFLFFFLKERRGLCSALILDKTEPPPEKPLVIGSKTRRGGVANEKRNNGRKTKGRKDDRGNIAVDEKKRQKRDGEWQVRQKYRKNEDRRQNSSEEFRVASSKDDEENVTIYSPQLATQ
jgi:hypothetical protein